MTPTLNLVPIWTTILAVGVFLYVALDGFDLGVGIIYLFVARTEPERAQALRSLSLIHI